MADTCIGQEKQPGHGDEVSSANSKSSTGSAKEKGAVDPEASKTNMKTSKQDKCPQTKELVTEPSPKPDPVHKPEQGQSNGKKRKEASSQGNEMSNPGESRRSESVKGPPVSLPRLMTQVELATAKNVTSLASQGKEAKENVMSPEDVVPDSPWTPDIFPLSPGAMETDPQSPVIVIGDEVYHIIDDCPPPPAPFPHQFVTLQPGDVSNRYDLNMDEVLGGGRYGEVHVCRERATGLQLVAKVLKIQSGREKEMALNEINVMNQLDHRNLIQMFDALETPSEIYLFLEYVEGGELFERIIDDSYQLMEVDAMVYVRQICEGIFYLHQMYVLHLDLKPENIVCVSKSSHMVKIIDFGLARRYKPQKKLKVSFGTAEFLAPEVVNFDFVSFPTDMWSVGVISYMMVSGLSPYLGDNETETLNNVLSSEVDFDEESFESVSDEAKDFISNLLIREKSGRMSAGQCLKHPWLNDLARKAKLCNRLLKSQIELRKYMMRRRWKKNVFAVTAANRFLKRSNSGLLTPLSE
ncbi:myosin light chain kinase 2, skeletal/cardiac muscle [Pelobates fuscus]|uniref:myosin light chain kinase 2, skeletal/cardiac muscle n=1 Tax=Pelobates fuscus TaxID=191477 RepID=UPI002FE45E30